MTFSCFCRVYIVPTESNGVLRRNGIDGQPVRASVRASVTESHRVQMAGPRSAPSDMQADETLTKEVFFIVFSQIVYFLDV